MVAIVNFSNRWAGRRQVHRMTVGAYERTNTQPWSLIFYFCSSHNIKGSLYSHMSYRYSIRFLRPTFVPPSLFPHHHRPSHQVDSAYVLDIADADIALLPKGQQVGGTGVTPQLPEGWLATAVPGMTAEFNSGAWGADGLLGWVLDNLGTFWWQSHTLSHLARDDLGESDCAIEDGGEF